MPDPKSKTLFDRVRGARDGALNKVAGVAVKATESDAYAWYNGTFLRAALLAQMPMRHQIKQMNDMMHTMGLPTRSDVTGIAERLTNIEMRLDDLDARLEQVLSHLEKSNGGGK